MKVLKSFKDKEDKLKLHVAGKSTYTHKNQKRTDELVAKGYVEAPKKEAPKKEEKKAEKK